jgi:hypothetical protein
MAFEHENLYILTFQQQDAEARSGAAENELQGLDQRIVRRLVSAARVKRHLAEMGRSGEPMYAWWEVIVRVASSPPNEIDVEDARAEYEQFDRFGKKFDALSLVLDRRMCRPGMGDDLPTD